MATYFWVSDKQWADKGLPVSDLQALADKGYGVAWKHGGYFALVEKESGEVTGLAKVKDQWLQADAVFKAKYKELTGHALVAAQVAITPQPVEFFLSQSNVQPNVQQVSKSKSKSKSKVSPLPSPTPTNPPGDELNLTTATDVGISVPGTQKQYRVFLISDDVNLAYRYQGQSLSIRAEKFTKEAQAALSAWGLDVKSGSRPYASTHVQVTDKTLVARTLGSLAASVLTGAPTKQLSKKEIV